MQLQAVQDLLIAPFPSQIVAHGVNALMPWNAFMLDVVDWQWISLLGLCVHVRVILESYDW